MVLNDEMKRMWKAAIAAYLKLLARHLCGLIEENHANPQSEQSVS
jgi:hypothetical protein